MAAPVDAGRAGYNGSTAATSHAISMPASIAAGDLLLTLIRVSGLQNRVAGGQINTDWTLWVDGDTTDGGNDLIYIYYKKASGSEGSTQTFTISGSEKVSAVTWRITGAADPTVYTPEKSTIATGASTTPDPTIVTPAAGSEDYLYLWAGCWEGEQTSPPASQPTGYSNPFGGNTGTGGAVATNSRCAGASKGTTASTSEDPGSWTISASDDWSAWTIAIRPAPTAKSGTDSATGSDASTLAVALPRTDTGGVPLASGDTGWKNGATGTSGNTGTAWDTPNNIGTQDATVASVTLNTLTESQDLRATAYGGTTVPTDATIVGVQVKVNVDLWTNDYMDVAVYLTKDGSTKSSGYNDLGFGTGDFTVPSSTASLWGYGSITPAEANSSTFGVILWSRNNDTIEAHQFDADEVALKLHYTTPGGGGEVAVTASDSSAKSGTDSSTGTDASSEAAALPGTESSTGTDTSALATDITATDSGAGTEASVLDQTKDGTDTGSGAEVSALEAAFPLADTGTGADSATDFTRDGITDSGAGSDASVLEAAYALTDTGAGTEASSVEQREDKAGTDTGSGADASALAVDLPQIDTGSGSDASTLEAALSATVDTGSGADAGAFDAAAYALTDTGTGADSATVGVAVLSATDTGTGDDVSTLVAVYAVTDTGSGADASALVADLAAVDSGAGLDASSLFTEDPNKVAADAGAGAEASALAVDLPQADTGSAADASTLTAVYAATDTGSGADASTLDQAYIATDTGAGAEEAVVLAVAIPVTETGTGTDASALSADLAATDSAAGTEVSDVFTGVIEKAGTDSGSGSEIVGEFARVLFDRIRAQTSKFGYGSYNVPPQRGWWVPAGNDDWSGIGTDQYLDYPKAFQDDVPYDTYKATATVSPFGVTDNVVATYFPGLYDNWSPEYITYASPNDVPVYIVFDIGTVASQSGCTIEARLTRNGVSFGNYISKAIPNGTGGVVLEADVNGSGWYGGTPWASSGTVISGGDLADPQFGIEFYVYSNRGTSTTVDITRITCNTQVLTPPVVSTGGGQGAVGEQGALNYASSDTGTGSDSSTLQVTHNRTDQCSSAEGEQWSNLEIGAHGYDDGTASEVASIANAVAVVESLVGVDASLLEALIGGTETGSSTDAAGGLGLATTDVGTGVESLGARTFGAVELISVLDVGDANWWLIGAPTDNTLALTATSVGTESLTPSTAGTQTLTPASTVTEVLTTANTDTSLVLNPIDYEPQ